MSFTDSTSGVSLWSGIASLGSPTDELIRPKTGAAIAAGYTGGGEDVTVEEAGGHVSKKMHYQQQEKGEEKTRTLLGRSTESWD